MKEMYSLTIILIIVTGVFAKEDDGSSMDIKNSDAKTLYDQRQTGKFNIHVNIKDVQFFSVKDSISSIGDYGSYDYGDYIDSDGDYDISHLTVSPILALLGQKPTTPKTTTTTEKASMMESNSSETIDKNEKESSTMKQELDTTVKQQSTEAPTTSTTTSKPALTESKTPLKVNETIDYEEIPVEVQYYRANHPKLSLSSESLKNNNRHIPQKRFRRPSVQILAERTNNNVKVIEQNDNEPSVKICARGEFRDNLGRCRIKANGRNRVAGL